MNLCYCFFRCDMIDKKNRKKIKQALLDKALGYTTQEVIEEYGYSGDEFVLQKRKTSTKSYPPDLSALQILIEGQEESGNRLANLTNEELEREKTRLINLLKEKQ